MAGSELEVIVITGRINSGKSTALVKLAEHERAEGNSPTGIIAGGIFDNGDKTGFKVTDLFSGKTMTLARIGRQIPDSFTIGRYIFSNEAFSFAIKALLNYKKAGVVFLDEVGPQELKGEGYHDCLIKLLNSDISRLYVTVRHGCLEGFKSNYLNGKKYRIIDIDITEEDISGL